MVVELAATTAGLISSTVDVLRTIHNVARDTDTKLAISGVVEKLAAAQALAIEAQRNTAADLERIQTLEKEVMELRDWSREKIRYELHQIKPGILAYRIKEAERGAEPEHGICAKCYADGKKSILQTIPAPNRITLLHCPSCKTDLNMSVGVSPVAWR